MTAPAAWEAGVAEARRRHPAKYEVAEKVAAEAREAARPKPPSELDGPIAMTPAARDLLEDGPAPHTAAGREAARRRIAARRQRGIQ